MAVSTVPPRPAAVQAVYAQRHRWQRGRRKADGRPFFVVPGSRSGVVYYADASDCTCPDSRERQRTCKHSLAVQQHERAQRQVAGAEHVATASPTSWRPCSRGCGELLSPEHVGKSCDACWGKLAATLDFLEPS